MASCGTSPVARCFDKLLFLIDSKFHRLNTLRSQIRTDMLTEYYTWGDSHRGTASASVKEGEAGFSVNYSEVSSVEWVFRSRVPWLWISFCWLCSYVVSKRDRWSEARSKRVTIYVVDIVRRVDELLIYIYTFEALVQSVLYCLSCMRTETGINEFELNEKYLQRYNIGAKEVSYRQTPG